MPQEHVTAALALDTMVVLARGLQNTTLILHTLLGPWKSPREGKTR